MPRSARSGAGPLTYQWSKDGAAIGGATTSVLALSNLQTNDAGNYQVTVTNTNATSGSGNVLTVT